MVKQPNARWRPARRFGNALLLCACAAPLAAGDAWATTRGIERDAEADAALPAAAGNASEVETLYLEVVLNQTRQPQLVRFERRGARLSADAEDLRRLGLVLADHASGDTVALDALPGVRVDYDAGMQRIAIDAPLELLSLSTTRLNAPGSTVPAAAAASPGALLNYDVYANHDGDAGSVSLSTELRIFGIGRGVLSNTAITRASRAAGGPWRNDSVRLDTGWQWSFPESAVTLTVGDSFSGFLGWTRPVRMGGVQVGRNFALQPYRVTTPLPAFLGEAVVPSAVELYVNGVRQYSGEVPVGPFQLNTVPGVSGAGFAQLVVTDAFGRVRTLDFPFYATQQLLAQGLSDWSLNLGAVRQEYGLRSFSYASEAVASGNLRHGVNDRFTVEAHAEGGGGLANAGIGGVWLMARAGVLSASHTRSSLDGTQGSQTAIAYAWNNGRFNFSLDSQRTRGDYRDIASLDGSLPPSVSERALAGVVLPGVGNLSASYVRLAYPDADLEPARFAGLFWTRRFPGGWSANLSYNRNLDDSRDRSLYAGVLLPLGRERHASASWQRSNGRDQGMVDLVRPVPGDGGYGWRLQARGGDGGSGGLAEAGWLGDHGRLGVGLARFAGQDYGYAQGSGALVWMAGHAFASRTVSDAFAVVSTDGIGGVPVKLENRVVGVTDPRGVLLVTPLNAWQRNKLSIDPMDLPADVRIADVDRIATPSDRAGVEARFAITPVRAAVVVLHDATGRPLPLGSRVELEGVAGADTVVGYDGETYLDALQARNCLRVRTSEGVCHVAFEYPEAAAAIPRVGPLRCQEEP